MKIPVLAKNFYENFYSVIKIWKKKKKLKKTSHFCQNYPVDKTSGQNMYQFLEEAIYNAIILWACVYS